MNIKYAILKALLDRVAKLLIGIRQSSHARHHTQNVVVHGVDADLRRALLVDRVDGHRQVQGRLVNAREVACAGRLVLLGLERERVHVDTRGRRAGVVLPGLHLVEVRSLALVEAILTVELHLGDLDRVLAVALDTRSQNDLRQQVVGRALEQLVVGVPVAVGIDARVDAEIGTVCLSQTHHRSTPATTRRCTGTRGGREGWNARAVGIRCQTTASQDVGDDTLRRPVIRVVERLLTRRLGNPGHRGRVAVNERITLAHPNQLLHGVVEVHLNLVGRRRDGLVTRELHLVNQVLVGLLGEAAALLRVEVHVVHVQGGSHQLELGDRRHTVAEAGNRVGCHVRACSHVVRIAAVVVLLELHVDAHLVVLQGNQGNRQTGVAAVPELQRNVQRLQGRAGTGHARVGHLGLCAGGIQRHTVGVLQEHQVGGVADHLVERHLGADGLGQLGPDLHPVTILAINAGASNLDLYHLEQAVTHIVQPAKAVTFSRQLDLGERHLDVRAVHQIGITGDHGGDTATKVSLPVEGHLNRLHREVGVSLVQHLPEGNLGVARDVNVLCTIRNKLHQTSSHFSVMISSKKNILERSSSATSSFGRAFKT